MLNMMYLWFLFAHLSDKDRILLFSGYFITTVFGRKYFNLCGLKRKFKE